MAEPSLQHVENLSSLFCIKYNQCNRTNFAFDCLEKPGKEVDFYIKDGMKEIGIQHSRIPNAETYYHSRSQMFRVNERIKEVAKKNGFCGSLSIQYNLVPIDNGEIRKLIEWVLTFVHTQLKASEIESSAELNDYSVIPEGIQKYLSEIEFQSTEKNDFSIIPVYETYSGPLTIDQEVDYYFNKISKKDSKYLPSNNLILLFEIAPSPVTGYGLNELIKKCSQAKFNCKEIWQIVLANNGICDKFYPC